MDIIILMNTYRQPTEQIKNTEYETRKKDE